MAFYNPPSYYFGSLNPVFNASDYETSTTNGISEATADKRYLKLSGGTMTGSLSVPTASITTSLSVPTASVSTSLSVPALTFSSNQTSQTAGQLGYIYSSTFTSTTITSNSIINLCQLSSIPIGVYLFYYNITFSNGTSATITKKYVSFSENSTTISDTFKMRNTSLVAEPITSTTVAQTSNTFIFKNTSSQTFYFNANLTVSTSISASGLVYALRIA